MKLIFHHKLFRVVTIARMLNLFGSYIYNVVFVIYAASMQDAPVYIFLANMTTIIPMFFTFWIGIRADRTRNKGLWIIRTGYLQAIIFTGIAFLIQDKNFLVFSLVCLGNILSDILGSYVGGLRIPILQKNLQEDELFTAFSFSQFILYICSIAGQTFGVWLLTMSNYDYALVAILNGVTFTLSSLIYWRHRHLLTHDEPGQSSTENTGLIIQLKTVWSLLQTIFKEKEQTSFKAILSIVLLSNMLGASLTPIFNFHLLSYSFWKLTYAQSLLVIELISIGGAVLGSLWTSDFLANYSLLRLLKINCLLLVSLGAIYLCNITTTASLICLFLVSYLTGKIGPKLDSLLMASLPTEFLAQSDSLISLLFSTSIPIGTFLFSSLASSNIRLTWLTFTLIGSLGYSLLTYFTKTANYKNFEKLSG